MCADRQACLANNRRLRCDATASVRMALLDAAAAADADVAPSLMCFCQLSDHARLYIRLPNSISFSLLSCPYTPTDLSVNRSTAYFGDFRII